MAEVVTDVGQKTGGKVSEVFPFAVDLSSTPFNYGGKTYTVESVLNALLKRSKDAFVKVEKTDKYTK